MFKLLLNEPTPSKSDVFSLAYKLMTVDQSKFSAFQPNAIYPRSVKDFLTPARLMISQYHSDCTLRATLNKTKNTAIFLA